MNTEGDLVKFAYASSYSNFVHPPRVQWRPFSQPIIFYHPEEHVEVFLALRDAPIQSCDNQDEEKKE
jgi:hypothetical protein